MRAWWPSPLPPHTERSLRRIRSMAKVTISEGGWQRPRTSRTTASHPGTQTHSGYSQLCRLPAECDRRGGPESHCRCVPKPSDFELYQAFFAGCHSPSISSFLCPLLYPTGPSQQALYSLSSFQLAYQFQNKLLNATLILILPCT